MYIVDEMLLVPAMPWRFYMFRGLKDQSQVCLIITLNTFLFGPSCRRGVAHVLVVMHKVSSARQLLKGVKVSCISIITPSSLILTGRGVRYCISEPSRISLTSQLASKKLKPESSHYSFWVL